MGGPRRAGEKLVAATAARIRRPPTVRGLARRRRIILIAKWLLPALALVLLVTIAVWPEVKRFTDDASTAVRRVAAEVGGAKLIDPHYHSLDEHGRPYTVTAATAQQVSEQRVNLTMPKGDMTLENGTWIYIEAKDGVFLKQLNELDLSHDVTLYRDDGTTMLTDSAALDLRSGTAAGAEPTHAEGPFGTLDAAGGFTLLDKGAAIQFAGPAHLVLNGATPAPAPAPLAPGAGPPPGTMNAAAQPSAAKADRPTSSGPEPYETSAGAAKPAGTTPSATKPSGTRQ
jgi:lipopolysaccharide export system protein LptC